MKHLTVCEFEACRRDSINQANGSGAEADHVASHDQTQAAIWNALWVR
ncbi:MAG: hypothetical protein P8N30_01245 [Tateyamaria sp.]|jgi:hypothetical protein|nr:hypothetical protein [Tateyamaria sp.]